MTHTPSLPATIHSLTQNLNRLLANAQEEWGIPREVKTSNTTLSQNDQGNSISDSPNGIHPLGQVNLARLSSDFSRNIELMRDILKKFRDTTLNEIANLPTDEPAIKKYFSLLKDEAKNLDTVSDIKDSVALCQDLILKSYIDSNLDGKLVIQQIKRMAEELHMQVYYDADKTGTEDKTRADKSLRLTLTGPVFVVDIQYDEITHTIQKVDVEGSNQQDPQVYNTLTHQLSAKNMKLFRKNLGALFKLDQFTKNYSSMNFFSYLKCITNDIQVIYEKERIASGDNINSISEVLVNGHGLPIIDIGRVGPSIAYWAPPFILLQTEWDFIKNPLSQGMIGESSHNFYQLWITMEESHLENGFLPSDITHYLLNDDDEVGDDFDVITEPIFSTSPELLKFIKPLRFIKPKESSTLLAHAHFVAWLDPPVYVAECVARELGNYASIKSRGHVFTQLYEKRDPDAMSLEQLLIQDAVPNPTLASLSNSLTPVAKWETQFEDSMYVQSYCLDSLFYTNAKKISRIPFTHLTQLYACIKLLRQQLIFNALFKSVFNSSSYRPPPDFPGSVTSFFEEPLQNGSNIIHLKIITQEPNCLSVNFQIPNKIPNTKSIYVSLQISIFEGQPYVLLQGGDTAAKLLDPTKMSVVLQRCQNVPILVRWILNTVHSLDDVDASVGAGGVDIVGQDQVIVDDVINNGGEIITEAMDVVTDFMQVVEGEESIME